MPETATPTPLSELLIALRADKKMNRYTLEQRSGVNHTNIRRIETGEISDITPALMQRLADALDVDVEQFYEAHWKTTGRPLPSLPTYFRTKYKKLTTTQIKQVEELVESMQKDNDRRDS